jgi:hypothetical protein
MGSPALAGWQMRRFAGDARVVHAWSPDALRAGRELALATGRAMVYSIPATPADAKGLADLRQAVGPGLLNVIVPTRFARARLIQAALPEKFCHVLAPAARALADAQAIRRHVRDALGIGEAVKLLVSPDPFVRHAGHEYASWSHAILRHIPLELRLAFPSEGPLEEHYRFFAATTGMDDEVHFTHGRFSPAEVLAASDIAVLPQTRDCGPMAMAASMAAGLAIAVSGAGGLTELARDGEFAMLMGTGPRQTSAALLKLADDEPLARRLATSAADGARQAFDPASVSERLQEIYAAAIETKAF